MVEDSSNGLGAKTNPLPDFVINERLGDITGILANLVPHLLIKSVNLVVAYYRTRLTVLSILS